MQPLQLTPSGVNFATTSPELLGANVRPGALEASLGPKQTGGFGEALSRAATLMVSPQQDAAAAVNSFAQGADGELHKTMLSLERADISMKYFVSLRNKALEAYREIMHMGS